MNFSEWSGPLSSALKGDKQSRLDLRKNFFKGNFMREIDSAHSRSIDPDSGNGVGVLKRKSNIFEFL